MANFFHTYFYQPILAALIFIYQNFAFRDLGVAIIFLTVFIRLVLFPLFYKSAKDQALINRLQPKIKEVQDKFKNNKEEQAKALMALYRENKLNPFSSLIMLFVQLPIIIALYQVFWRELSNSTFDNHLFLGLINLGERSLVMAFLAAVFQYFQGKLSLLPPQKTDSSANANLPAASVGKTMIFVGPLLTVLVLSALPSALGLYWITSTVFSIAQQVYINKKLKNHLNNYADNRGKT